MVSKCNNRVIVIDTHSLNTHKDFQSTLCLFNLSLISVFIMVTNVLLRFLRRMYEIKIKM